jgi:hypothetical protein
MEIRILCDGTVAGREEGGRVELPDYTQGVSRVTDVLEKRSVGLTDDARQELEVIRSRKCSIGGLGGRVEVEEVCQPTSKDRTSWVCQQECAGLHAADAEATQAMLTMVKGKGESVTKHHRHPGALAAGS